MNSKIKKRSAGDRFFYIVNAIFLTFLAIVILYPVYFIIIASISDPDAVLGGQVFLYPVKITFEGFEKILHRSDIWRGYLNTIWYTLVTVILSLFVTIPAGWALSRKEVLDAVLHHSHVLRRRTDTFLQCDERLTSG